MSAFDRYVLAEALMGGNASFRWILADLLSEQGDQESADFARRTRATRDGDLDVAIRQLPCPEVVVLGCDFVEHVVQSDQAGLLSQLARVRRLLRRSASPEQFDSACRGLSEYRSVTRSWYDVAPLIVMDDAVHNLAAALGAAAPAARGRWLAAEATRQAAVAITACARSVREVLQQRYRIKKKPRELDWQIKRTRELLGELIAARTRNPPSA